MTLSKSFLEEIEQVYGKDAKTIKKAFEFAKEKHAGQIRENGEEYIVHLVGTAKILVEMRADVETVVSGFLHDIIEDAGVSENEIEKKFGSVISNIVVALSKFENIKNSRLQNLDENENLRKMILTLGDDSRVAFTKLADRLDNMRSLGIKERIKQVKIAQETLDLFVPTAERLGMSKLRKELENLCFMYMFPEDYLETTNFIEENYKKREKITEDINEKLAELAQKQGIKNFRLQSRIKSNYSLFQKLQKKGKEGIYDVVAHRVIVKDVKECYAMLGAINEYWKPIEGRIKDYIAHPKKNLYMSLHTTVLYPTDGMAIPFEVQIRTEEMHNFCEYGMAAHWMYKEKGSDAQIDAKNLKMLNKMQENFAEKRAEDSVDIVKTGFYPNSIFVFTPKLNVIELDKGSITVDMAYAIHTAIGNRCTGAKVNGKMVPIDTKLRTGDLVEIICAQNSKGPSKDWLKIVAMDSTKNKINIWFRKNMRDEHIKKGKAILEQAAKAKGYAFSSLLEGEWVDGVFEKMKINDLDEIYAQVGYGSIPSSQIVNRLINLYEQAHKKEEKKVGKSFGTAKKSGDTDIFGLSGIMTKLAKCCTPIPGDEIVGYISRGSGITIHRADCPVVSSLEPDRMMSVSWGDKSQDEKYSAEMRILAKNSPGTFGAITNKLGENKININFVFADIAKTKSEEAVFNIGIDVSNKKELVDIINKLEAMPEVYKIIR